MQQRSQKLHFSPACPTRPGWYEVLVDMQDYPMISIHSLLQVEIKFHHEKEPSFFPFTLTENGLHTFFYVDTPIIELSLHFSINTIVSTIIKPRVRKCSAFYAITSIIRIISKRDSGNGINITRIYRKSYARFRKYGYTGFMKRLLKEYHLADTYLISDEDMYQMWIAHNETYSLKPQSTIIENISFKPIISIIMATWRSNLRWLEAAIQSVESQSYPSGNFVLLMMLRVIPVLHNFFNVCRLKTPVLK